MNIILCGFPNSGKTTCGALVADKLNYSFVDTDKLIEEKYNGLPCCEVHKKIGETNFRTLEKEIVDSLSSISNTVISTGGGTLVKEENKHVLSKIGEIFYLQADRDTLYKRMQDTRVPSVIDSLDNFDQFFQSRTLHYQATADFIIDTSNKTSEAIADEIINTWRQHGH